jgi:hypothetical protein
MRWFSTLCLLVASTALAGCLQSKAPLLSPPDFQPVAGFDRMWKYAFDGKPGAFKALAQRDGSYRVQPIEGGQALETGMTVGFVPLTDGHFLVQRCDAAGGCLYALGVPKGAGWEFRWFFGESDRPSPGELTSAELTSTAGRHGVSLVESEIQPGTTKPALLAFFRELLDRPGPAANLLVIEPAP